MTVKECRRAWRDAVLALVRVLHARSDLATLREAVDLVVETRCALSLAIRAERKEAA